MVPANWNANMPWNGIVTVLHQRSSLVAHWLTFLGSNQGGGEKNKLFPYLFLSYDVMIAVYSLLCKVIDSWIKSTCLAFNTIEKSNKLIEQKTICQQILPNRHNPFHSTFSSGCVCLWLSTLHTRQLPDPCRSCHRMLPEMRWRWFSNAELWCKGRWVNHSAGNPWHIGCIHGLWRRPVMEKNMLSHCLQIFQLLLWISFLVMERACFVRARVGLGLWKLGFLGSG